MVLYAFEHEGQWFPYALGPTGPISISFSNAFDWVALNNSGVFLKRTNTDKFEMVYEYD